MSTSHSPAGPGDQARDPVSAEARTDTATGAEEEVEDPYGFPRGVPAIGGHFPDFRRGGLLPGGGRAGLPIEPRLAALNRDYPAWRIIWFRCSDGSAGGWWAMHRAPLTAGQRAAGLLACIARGDLVSLVSEVTVQDDIAAGLERPADAEARPDAARTDGHPDRRNRADIENVRTEKGKDDRG